MEKKDQVIAVLTVIAVILAGVLIYNLVGKETIKIDPSETSDCSSITSEYAKDSCYLNLARENKDASFCASIANVNIEDVCYTEVSKLVLDKTLCEKVADKYYSKPKCFAELLMMGVK